MAILPPESLAAMMPEPTTVTRRRAVASASAAWLAGARQSASAAATRETAVRDRTVESLSNARGVNVDEELSRLLDVERAYQASAKLLTTLDDMFGSLLQAVG